MTDKEQIMIDGVQFNKFGDFFIDYDFNGKFQSISSSAKEYKILKSLIEQLARSNKIIEQQQKTLDELIGEVGLWESFTEEESKLAKDSSIADLIILLREKDERILELTKEALSFEQKCAELKEEKEEIKKYLGISYKTIMQRLEELTEYKFKRQLEYIKIQEENDRYRKALEEIERELTKYQAFILGKPITQRENDCLYKICDNINKAKGEDQ